MIFFELYKCNGLYKTQVALLIVHFGPPKDTTSSDVLSLSWCVFYYDRDHSTTFLQEIFLTLWSYVKLYLPHKPTFTIGFHACRTFSWEGEMFN